MTDAWAAAAAGWGSRSTVTAAGIADRDCTGRTGGGGNGGNGGGGGKGGANGDGKGTGGCRCDCHQHGHHEHGCHDHGHHEHGCHHHDCGCHTHERCRCGCHAAEDDDAGTAGEVTGRPGGGITLGWKNPNRPARHYGTSTGVIPSGQLDPCDFSTPPWKADKDPNDPAYRWNPNSPMQLDYVDAPPVVIIESPAPGEQGDGS